MSAGTSTAGDALLDAGADVVIRWRAYGNYGGEAGARKALRRRVPGHPPDRYASVLGDLCAVYDRAVAVIARHQAERAGKRGQVAGLEDIDTRACLAELDAAAPEVPARVKQDILLRALYWHYLR